MERYHDLGVLAAAASGGHGSTAVGSLSLLGLSPTAAYLLAAIPCVMAGLASLRRSTQAGSLKSSSASVGPPVSSRFWWISAFLLLLLGFNRQFDLLSAVTGILRSTARAQGWYEIRQGYQRMFIATIALAGLIGCLALSWALRRAGMRYQATIGGLFFLLAFVAIRAASLHEVDAFLRRGVLGLRWNWIVELCGIAVVAVSALAAVRAYKRASIG